MEARQITCNQDNANLLEHSTVPSKAPQNHHNLSYISAQRWCKIKVYLGLGKMDSQVEM